MKKVKKLLAMIMAMTMVLGMSLTSFAADAAKITVNGLTPNDETTVEAYEIMTWDEESNNWVIEDWARQYVHEPVAPAKVYTIDWTDIYDAIKNDEVTVEPLERKVLGENETSCEFTNNLGLGAYFIYATGIKTVYNPMGVTTYEYAEDDHLIGPFEATVYAKGASYDLTKEFSDEYNTTVAGIGDTVKYDIETIFPSFDKNSTNKKFSITDKPTGLKITGIAVYVGDTLVTENVDYTLSTALPSETDVTIDFTSTFIGDNVHAAADVRVEVTAEVTDITYENEVTATNYQDEDPVPPVIRDTGSMEITKVDEDGNVLTGAEFKISRVSEAEALYFTKEADGSYRYAPEEISGTSRVNTLPVDATGKLKVTGLSGGEYTITEVKAPNGYAITEPLTKTIVLAEKNEEGGTDNEVLHLVFDVVNTRLASLPSTGGIGTTIFTIGGCAIMIAAAGLYFASRRKQENK